MSSGAYVSWIRLCRLQKIALLFQYCRVEICRCIHGRDYQPCAPHRSGSGVLLRLEALLVWTYLWRLIAVLPVALLTGIVKGIDLHCPECERCHSGCLTGGGSVSQWCLATGLTRSCICRFYIIGQLLAAFAAAAFAAGNFGTGKWYSARRRFRLALSDSHVIFHYISRTNRHKQPACILLHTLEVLRKSRSDKLAE